MPLVPCLGFVGLAFAAIGFADLHLFGFAPSWVRVPREGIEPPRPKFQVYSLAQPTNSCLRGLARPHLSILGEAWGGVWIGHKGLLSP